MIKIYKTVSKVMDFGEILSKAYRNIKKIKKKIFIIIMIIMKIVSKMTKNHKKFEFPKNPKIE